MHLIVDEDVCQDLIRELESVNHYEIETKGYLNKLKARVAYVNTKYKLIEESKFHNIVKNDIAYYLEKEKVRLAKLNFESNNGEQVA